jgi:c-di-GMP-related signal transduction protein
MIKEAILNTIIGVRPIDTIVLEFLEDIDQDQTKVSRSRRLESLDYLIEDRDSLE